MAGWRWQAQMTWGIMWYFIIALVQLAVSIGLLRGPLRRTTSNFGTSKLLVQFRRVSSSTEFAAVKDTNHQFVISPWCYAEMTGNLWSHWPWTSLKPGQHRVRNGLLSAPVERQMNRGRCKSLSMHCQCIGCIYGFFDS